MTRNCLSLIVLSMLMTAVSDLSAQVPACPSPNAMNVFIVYQGTTPQCNPTNAAVCAAGETVEFSIRTFGPMPSECVGNVTWMIAGQQILGRTIQFTFAQPGTYPVVATVSNATWVFNASTVISVISTPPFIPTLSLSALFALGAALVGVAVFALSRS